MKRSVAYLCTLILMLLTMWQQPRLVFAVTNLAIGSANYSAEFYDNGIVSALRREMPIKSTPRMLILQTLTKEEIEQHARDFIDANPELFQVPSSDLYLVSAQQIGEQWLLAFLQLYEGVAVYDSAVDLTLDENGEVLQASTRNLFTGTISTNFIVSKQDAVNLALNRCDQIDDCTRNDNPLIKGYLVVFAYQPPEGEQEVRLAWHLSFKQRNFFVDANNGEILADITNVIFAAVNGTVTGNHSDWGNDPSFPTIREPLQNLQIQMIEPIGVIEIPIHVAQDSKPVISGNGEVVVFVSDFDGDKEIYKVDFDGQNLVKLTNNSVEDDQPVVNDDGTSVVFVSQVAGEQRLFRINANGSGLTPVTAAGTGNKREPSLSGDGTGIAFVSDRTGNNEIYYIQSNGSGEIPLTNNGVDNRHPSISDDGSLISFASNLDGSFELYTVTNSGSDLDQITFNTADADEPSINDLGNGIAFSSDNAGNDGIYLTQFDPIFGWVLSQLSSGSTNDLQPDLSGDGTKVAFASDREGDFEVFTIAADGSDETRLTFNPGIDWCPSISDDGLRVIYASSNNAIATIRIIGIPLVTQTTWTDPDPLFLLISPLHNLVINPPGGDYTLDCPNNGSAGLYASLLGKNVRVKNLAGSTLGLNKAACPPPLVDFWLNPVGAPDTNNAQVNAYYYTDAAYSYLDQIFFRTLLPNPLENILANVNGRATQCNAYYFFGLKMMNFYQAGGGCPNSAYDSIIFHEYGHFLHDSIWQDLWKVQFPWEERLLRLSEGIGDMTALFATGILGNPSLGIIGKGFNPPPKPPAEPGIPRNYNKGGNWYDRQLENQINSDRYVEGGAFAGFAWQSRDRMSGKPGGRGINDAEDVFFGSLLFKQTNVRDAAIQVFLTDDNPFMGKGGNNRIEDETPNYDALRLSACEHNLDAVPYPGSPWLAISFDFGDASPPYPTNAEHGTIDCERLGKTVSREVSTKDNFFDEDLMPNLSPMDRDDDDGVEFKKLSPGQNMDINVTVSVAEGLRESGRYNKDLPNHRIYLNAWADWNGDGKWDEADGEKIIGTKGEESDKDTLALDPKENDGKHGFNGKDLIVKTFNTVMVPKNLTDKPFVMRFRLDFGEDAGKIKINQFMDASFKGAVGRARYGEVEDYLVCVNLATGKVATKIGEKLETGLDLLTQQSQGNETMFSDQISHAFFGNSPAVPGSRTVLLINEANKTLRFMSNDSILGVIDSGPNPITPKLWRVLSTSDPIRIIFSHDFVQGDGKKVSIQGDVWLKPNNRVVVDVIADKKRVRYSLKDCYQMATN